MSYYENVKTKRKFVETLHSRLVDAKPFIQVVTGPRQVGKTTGVRQLVNDWKQGAVVFETADQYPAPTTEWIEVHWQRAKQLGKNSLLIFDEIQKVKGWSEVVKRLFDETRHSGLRVVVLGSASLLMAQGTEESLAGRFESIAVPHWSFGEMQREFDLSLDEYLTYGGYPLLVQFREDKDRLSAFLTQSIIAPVVEKDISGLAKINNPTLFRQVFELGVEHPAQVVSYNKFLGQLQERGNASTVKGYLKLLESAFLLRLLQRYSEGQVSVKSSSPKLIPMCPALTNSGNGIWRMERDKAWRGRVVEAAIGATLANNFPQIFYWRDGNLEVDYIVSHRGKLYAIEVKSGLVAAKHKGLAAFARLYPHAIPVILECAGIEAVLKSDNAQQILDVISAR